MTGVGSAVATPERLLGGRYASIVLARDAAPDLAHRLAFQAMSEPLMGDWAPDRLPAALRPDDGIIVAGRDQRPVGLIRSFEAYDLPGARLLSLFLADRTGGTAFFLEGALRYCLWRFAQSDDSLYAQVLDGNRRMLTLLRKMGIEPKARLRRARYLDGGWHDLLLFAISAESLHPTLQKYCHLLGLAET